VVETDGQLTCELKMLSLVFADWDVSGVVEQDVGSLEDRVREETEFEGVFVVCGIEGGGIGWEGEFALKSILTACLPIRTFCGRIPSIGSCVPGNPYLHHNSGSTSTLHAASRYFEQR
jgi:hypothetical protein